ncbi:hypothetical protein FB567DRAFT_556603 [Paraphoma chrysanthemicola]|uniref:Fungal N-terminal domain-containing protein n=1 Tax=Paraphoma chrysanthemicola TaxID=798071 RepID=A0A8K0W4I8_9PLEO|nr:hypothetical protein FB567DRAFT_556603 [Paraphoma chrysanthemicola]
MSYGFSVGDFIAVGKLIADITSSLQTTGGAKSEYQELVREFESLSAALRHLDRLDHGATHSSVVDSIKYAALSCRYPLEDFMQKIEKYDKSLGIRNQSSRMKAVSEKLRWTFGHGGEIRKLQMYLNVHIGTINILLMEHGLERMDLNSKKVDVNAQQVRRQLDSNTAILENLDTGLSSQTSLLRNAHSMLGSLYSFVRGDVQTSVQHFCRVINEVCISTKQIYAVVLDIRDNLLDTRWTYFQACVKVEDALGVFFSIPAECDYYMLVTIIERKFETGIGAADVQSGNYELCLTQKRSELITAETKLMPGIAITMAIMINTSTASYGVCPMPGCGSTKASATVGGAFVW